MSKCFDVVGYVEPCNAVRQKYTGRALLITGIADNESINPTFSDNGLKVTGMSAGTEFVGFIDQWNKGGGKALPVFINAENPYGVTVQGNTDSGRVMYTKTIPISVYDARDGKAEEFIMGLQKGFYGSAVIVLETFGLEMANNINNNDIFGAYSPIRIDPASVTRSEYENGGAWNFNLVCEEPVPNVICTMGGLNTALDSMNA